MKKLLIVAVVLLSGCMQRNQATLDINTVPSGAQVYGGADGRFLCETPCKDVFTTLSNPKPDMINADLKAIWISGATETTSVSMKPMSYNSVTIVRPPEAPNAHDDYTYQVQKNSVAIQQQAATNQAWSNVANSFNNTRPTYVNVYTAPSFSNNTQPMMGIISPMRSR